MVNSGFLPKWLIQSEGCFLVSPKRQTRETGRSVLLAIIVKPCDLICAEMPGLSVFAFVEQGCEKHPRFKAV